MKEILILGGDGIGPEVTKSACAVLSALCKKENINDIHVQFADFGGCAIDKYSNPLPEDTLMQAKKADAILLGAVGGTQWDKSVIRPEQGLLRLRKELQVFANYRPAIVFNELVIASSLKEALIKDLDILIIRELTGGDLFWSATC